MVLIFLILYEFDFKVNIIYFQFHDHFLTNHFLSIENQNPFIILNIQYGLINFH